MGGEILEGVEAGAEAADIRDVTIEEPYGLAQHEVARGPGVRPAEVAGEEPVGRPLADPAKGDERRFHLVVRERREGVEVELGAGERDRVLGLASREADRDELGLVAAGEPLARGEGDRVLGRLAEALDQAAANRERRLERDLLGRDRGDERLERIGRERRAEAGEAEREAARGPGRSAAKAAKPARSKARPEQRPHLRLDLAAPGLDLDAAGCSLDPHLAPADDAVQAALEPEIRPVDSEDAKALGREREVVRLGQRQQHGTPIVPATVSAVRVCDTCPPCRTCCCQGWSLSPAASIATNFSMFAARVSGFFASWSRCRIA